MIGHYTTGLGAGRPAEPLKLGLPFKRFWASCASPARSLHDEKPLAFRRRFAAMDLLLVLDPSLVGEVLCAVADLLPFPNVCV